MAITCSSFRSSGEWNARRTKAGKRNSSYKQTAASNFAGLLFISWAEDLDWARLEMEDMAPNMLRRANLNSNGKVPRRESAKQRKDEEEEEVVDVDVEVVNIKVAEQKTSSGETGSRKPKLEDKTRENGSTPEVPRIDSSLVNQGSWNDRLSVENLVGNKSMQNLYYRNLEASSERLQESFKKIDDILDDSIYYKQPGENIKSKDDWQAQHAKHLEVLQGVDFQDYNKSFEELEEEDEQMKEILNSFEKVSNYIEKWKNHHEKMYCINKFFEKLLTRKQGSTTGNALCIDDFKKNLLNFNSRTVGVQTDKIQNKLTLPQPENVWRNSASEVMQLLRRTRSEQDDEVRTLFEKSAFYASQLQEERINSSKLEKDMEKKTNYIGYLEREKEQMVNEITRLDKKIETFETLIKNTIVDIKKIFFNEDAAPNVDWKMSLPKQLEAWMKFINIKQLEMDNQINKTVHSKHNAQKENKLLLMGINDKDTEIQRLKDLIATKDEKIYQLMENQSKVKTGQSSKSLERSLLRSKHRLSKRISASDGNQFPGEIENATGKNIEIYDPDVILTDSKSHVNVVNMFRCHQCSLFLGLLKDTIPAALNELHKVKTTGIMENGTPALDSIMNGLRMIMHKQVMGKDFSKEEEELLILKLEPTEVSRDHHKKIQEKQKEQLLSHKLEPAEVSRDLHARIQEKQKELLILKLEPTEVSRDHHKKIQEKQKEQLLSHKLEQAEVSRDLHERIQEKQKELLILKLEPTEVSRDHHKKIQEKQKEQLVSHKLEPAEVSRDLHERTQEKQKEQLLSHKLEQAEVSRDLHERIQEKQKVSSTSVTSTEEETSTKPVVRQKDEDDNLKEEPSDEETSGTPVKKQKVEVEKKSAESFWMSPAEETITVPVKERKVEVAKKRPFLKHHSSMSKQENRKFFQMVNQGSIGEEVQMTGKPDMVKQKPFVPEISLDNDREIQMEDEERSHKSDELIHYETSLESTEKDLRISKTRKSKLESELEMKDMESSEIQVLEHENLWSDSDVIGPYKFMTEYGPNSAADRLKRELYFKELQNSEKNMLIQEQKEQAEVDMKELRRFTIYGPGPNQEQYVDMMERDQSRPSLKLAWMDQYRSILELGQKDQSAPCSDLVKRDSGFSELGKSVMLKKSSVAMMDTDASEISRLSKLEPSAKDEDASEISRLSKLEPSVKDEDTSEISRLSKHKLSAKDEDTSEMQTVDYNVLLPKGTLDISTIKHFIHARNSQKLKRKVSSNGKKSVTPYAAGKQNVYIDNNSELIKFPDFKSVVDKRTSSELLKFTVKCKESLREAKRELDMVEVRLPDKSERTAEKIRKDLANIEAALHSRHKMNLLADNPEVDALESLTQCRLHLAEVNLILDSAEFKSSLVQDGQSTVPPKRKSIQEDIKDVIEKFQDAVDSLVRIFQDHKKDEDDVSVECHLDVDYNGKKMHLPVLKNNQRVRVEEKIDKDVVPKTVFREYDKQNETWQLPTATVPKKGLIRLTSFKNEVVPSCTWNAKASEAKMMHRYPKLKQPRPVQLIRNHLKADFLKGQQILLANKNLDSIHKEVTKNIGSAIKLQQYITYYVDNVAIPNSKRKNFYSSKNFLKNRITEESAKIKEFMPVEQK